MDPRPDGTQYIGTFMNDANHGHGKYTYPDGGTDVGEFAQGEPLDFIILFFR